MDDHLVNDEDRFAPEKVCERFADARARITAASRAAGRPEPKLVAVTKTVPVETINFAIENLGVTAIGENRVQELLSKYDSLASPPSGGKLSVHLIGTLQKNKVKYIIDKVDMIESVDSLSLAAEIDRQAKKHGLTMDILIEVNVGREPQKGGVMPENVGKLICDMSSLSSLRLRGLMTVAPKCDKKEDYLKYFSEICSIFLDISRKMPHNIYMGDSVPGETGTDGCHIDLSAIDILSMGMSGSFEEAIACGSTEIRLGSTLFGSRPPMAPVNDPPDKADQT